MIKNNDLFSKVEQKNHKFKENIFYHFKGFATTHKIQQHTRIYIKLLECATIYDGIYVSAALLRP